MKKLFLTMTVLIIIVLPMSCNFAADNMTSLNEDSDKIFSETPQNNNTDYNDIYKEQ